METLTESKVNKHFLIKWRTSGETRTSFNKLIGAGPFKEKFGERYAEKFFAKAYNSLEDRVEFKIRGKYVITFISR